MDFSHVAAAQKGANPDAVIWIALHHRNRWGETPQD
jgi:hypothetical protein